MRTSRIVIVILVVAVIVVAAIYAVTVLTSTPPLCTSTWECAAGYPVQVGGTFAIAGAQCLSTNSSIYCIGGQDFNGGPRNEVYHASPVTSSGNITGWALSNSYPQYINGESCVLDSGFVYCVGGMYNDNGDDVSSSYYASVTASGSLGNWTSTTAFPIPVDTQSCVASLSNIYCVGGANETDGSNADATATNSVWYAPLSTSGIGQWSLTTAYPANVYFPSCFVAASDIYCLGGADTDGNSLGTAYYATISSSGVGAWTTTTSYPVAGSGQACVVYSVDVVCVGGETAGGSSPAYTNSVYYAPISSGGIGTWKQAATYPIGIGTTCVSLSADVYCIGGFDSSGGENNIVEYASLASLTS